MTMKLIPIAAVLGLFASPTFAQDSIACNEDTIAAVAAEVEVAPEAQKEVAMAELAMAKEMMAAGDEATCSVHLTNASNASTAQ